MAPRLYWYRNPDTGVVDANAPVLTGVAGSLVALLKACLVNGYTGFAAAGWTNPFNNGANQAAFRNSTVGGTGHYLSVDDNAPGNLAGRHSRVRGFETLTAWATGTGPFPTTTQIVNGITIYKSATADATPREWFLLADEKTFYLFTDVGPTGEINGYSAFMFGDIYSEKVGDAYRSAIIGRAAEFNPGAQSGDEERFQDTSALSTVNTGHYMPRTYAGSIQSAIGFGKHCTDLAKKNLVPYPNPPNQGLYLAQLGVHEDVGNQGVPRGRLRGVWDFLHDPMVRVNDLATWSGSGALAGKTFRMLKPLGGTAGAIRCIVLETSDTWETSA